jgi:hypothetical protein
VATLGKAPFASIPPAFPLDFALVLRDICHVNVFVETGTYHGETTRLVAPHFAKVYTIEGSRERWEAIQGTFPENVEAICGDSAIILGDVLRGIRKRCMIFLDAHWIHAGTSVENDVYQGDLSLCPVLAELKQIKPSSVILIDDLFFFDYPPKGRGKGWPSLDQIMALLGNRYVFVWKGRLCAVPNIYREPMRKWLVNHWQGKNRYDK